MLKVTQPVDVTPKSFNLPGGGRPHLGDRQTDRQAWDARTKKEGHAQHHPSVRFLLPGYNSGPFCPPFAERALVVASLLSQKPGLARVIVLTFLPSLFVPSFPLSFLF